MTSDVESLTALLVSVDSVSDRSTETVASPVVDRLRALGARVCLQRIARGAVDQVNVLGRLGEGEGGLLLAGHLDTVPWREGQKATTHPVREGGLLYGRGACDMKGGIAAQLVAAAAEAAGRPMRRPLWFCFTFEEEVGCHGARFAREFGWVRAEHAIVAEPTGLVPMRTHKGYAVIEAVLRGRAGHSSDPGAAASAVDAAGEAVVALRRLARALEAEAAPDLPLHPPWPTLNVGRVSGGVAPNVVAEECRLTVDVRPLPGSDREALIARVEAAIAEAAAAVPGVVASFSRGHELLAFESPADAPIVRFLEERTGARSGGVSFATEAPIHGGGGTAAVVCGPGSIAAAHREDENVPLDDLHRAERLYREAIDAFCR